MEIYLIFGSDIVVGIIVKEKIIKEKLYKFD